MQWKKNFIKNKALDFPVNQIIKCVNTRPMFYAAQRVLCTIDIPVIKQHVQLGNIIISIQLFKHCFSKAPRR